MTLTEFLLARIAEDKAEASEVHDRDCDTNKSPEIGGFPCDCPWPTRVLVECEVKRRIVEECRQGIRSRKTAHILAFDHILFALALRYTDHPDYHREEWRP